MSKSKNTVLWKLAKDTARILRKRTAIPGWHMDKSRFPESDFTDIVRMLEKAYSLAVEDACKKHKALIDAITDQAEWGGCSERGTMESLMEIFDPEDLVRLGYGNRVKAYLEECGRNDEWDEISRKVAEDETV